MTYPVQGAPMARVVADRLTALTEDTLAKKSTRERPNQDAHKVTGVLPLALIVGGGVIAGLVLTVLMAL